MRWLSGALLALAVLLLAAAAGIGWLVGTEQGLQWAAARVPGLHTEGLRGHLAGEVTAETLSFESSAVRLRAEQVSVRAHLAALLGRRLTLEPLRAQKIELELRSAGEKPSEPFRLPLQLHIGNARVDLLQALRRARYDLAAPLDRDTRDFAGDARLDALRRAAQIHLGARRELLVRVSERAGQGYVFSEPCVLDLEIADDVSLHDKRIDARVADVKL